ncbi:hypothetical protein GCWU000341_01805, partial [Oribacterium sp. oral taxon 078 str. F0262]
TLAFFAKFITPFDNAGFRNPIFFCEAPHGSAFLQAETDNLFLKWFVVRLWHDKILHLLLYFISHLCYNFSLSLQSHINSYRRKTLGNKSPYEMFAFQYGEDILKSSDSGKFHPTKSS